MVWDRRRGDGASLLPGRRPSVLRGTFNELGSSVTTYRFDRQLGSLQPTRIVPSIPPSYTGNNTVAEIAVAPSGGVVYASNRGHDSIAIFAVDRHDGTLTSVGWAPTHAKV
jgi:6-phosphogluconolactonase